MLTKLLQSPCSGELSEHFEQCSDMLYSISMCSNSVQTARHALVCCSNTVQTICPCLAMFKHFKQCSDITHCFACCGHVILHFHAFEQCSNCTLMPTTCGESFLFLFSFSSSLFFVYSHSRLPTSASTHAHLQHVHTPIPPLRKPVSLSFFFLSFFTVIRFCMPICMPACPHVRMPIHMLRTN